MIRLNIALGKTRSFGRRKCESCNGSLATLGYFLDLLDCGSCFFLDLMSFFLDLRDGCLVFLDFEEGIVLVRGIENNNSDVFMGRIE